MVVGKNALLNDGDPASYMSPTDLSNAFLA